MKKSSKKSKPAEALRLLFLTGGPHVHHITDAGDNTEGLTPGTSHPALDSNSLILLRPDYPGRNEGVTMTGEECDTFALQWLALRGLDIPLTDSLAFLLRCRGFNVTFQDHDAIEIEYNRENPVSFPHRYTILGLSIAGRRLNWSIEPMYKPEDGDSSDDSWRPGEKRRVHREIHVERLQMLGLLNQLKLRWGKQISTIFPSAS